MNNLYLIIIIIILIILIIFLYNRNKKEYIYEFPGFSSLDKFNISHEIAAHIIDPLGHIINSIDLPQTQDPKPEVL